MRYLKKCPFCGCPGMVIGGGSNRMGRLPARIECRSRLCMVGTQMVSSAEKAAEIWNNRTNHEESESEGR